MGHYTQFKFKAKLKEVPSQLDELLNDTDNYLGKLWGHERPTIYSVTSHPEFPIDHEFGKCTRWFALLDNATLKHSNLEVDSEFKNYNDEIEMFREWIEPYCDQIIKDRDTYIGQL